MNENLNFDLLKQDVEKEIKKKVLKIFIMLYLMRTVICLGLFTCIIKIINL